MGKTLISMSRYFQVLLVTLIAALGVAALAAPAHAASSVTVTSNPVEGSPYEVQTNKDSMLTYKLTYTLGADAEGNTPSVSSIKVTFSVNNGGTIQESGSSTWTETLSNPPFSSPMALSCEASGPTDGNYSVTCEATLNLSDGTTASGGPASDTFLVAALTVTVTGDPYVIIPADGTPDSDTTSSYTATVQSDYGDNGFFRYTWVVPSNIEYASGTEGSSSDQISAWGVSTPGPTTIQCDVVDNYTGQTQSGSKKVTVAVEYTYVGMLDDGKPENQYSMQHFTNETDPNPEPWTVTYTRQKSYSNTFSLSGGGSLSADDIGELKAVIGYTVGSTDTTTVTDTAGPFMVAEGNTDEFFYGPTYDVYIYIYDKNYPSGTSTPVYPEKEIYDSFGMANYNPWN